MLSRKTCANNKITPNIFNQLIHMDEEQLCLRNPEIAECAFMGKLYVSLSLAFIAAVTLQFLEHFPFEPILLYLYVIGLAAPLCVGVFLCYRIHLLKHMSHYSFNRITQRISAHCGNKQFMCSWAHAELFVFTRNGFNGSGIFTQQSLALRDRYSPTRHSYGIAFCIEGNPASFPDPAQVFSLKAYIEQFMAHGPEGLPLPTYGNWWQMPNQRIYLTPKEAWQHYVPWRTGEPWEEQGKPNRLLPLWLVFLPWNLYAALCWYATCRLFKVQQAAPWDPDKLYCAPKC